jgi:hypothetical protein
MKEPTLTPEQVAEEEERSNQFPQAINNYYRPTIGSRQATPQECPKCFCRRLEVDQDAWGFQCLCSVCGHRWQEKFKPLGDKP